MSEITIREAVPGDIPELRRIYAYYVENTAVSFAYNVPSEEEFRRLMFSVKARYPYIVAELDGKIAGYCYAHPFVGRTAYDWSCEMTIYLDSSLRRMGIGRALYSRAEGILERMGIFNLYACIGVPVREDAHLNNDSMNFHSRMGYRLVGRFEKCGYKFDTWYDMVWMEKQIGKRPYKALPVKPPVY